MYRLLHWFSTNLDSAWTHGFYRLCGGTQLSSFVFFWFRLQNQGSYKFCPPSKSVFLEDIWWIYIQLMLTRCSFLCLEYLLRSHGLWCSWGNNTWEHITKELKKFYLALFVKHGFRRNLIQLGLPSNNFNTIKKYAALILHDYQRRFNSRQKNHCSLSFKIIDFYLASFVETARSETVDLISVIVPSSSANKRRFADEKCHLSPTLVVI